ncbi:superoxide dismutase [Helicobacter monodelphidis]|uniref:superoxide dismutase n=1 Tax=Helicobacter sp. 15-1451 TaxID=2004995 RepID=UPI000DCD8A6A|nr:superoxide dismutase [Helicobacter sp. 15-1451]RAX57921.1 superoxide dismutase [Helicobacter sp. 15-1451]
MFELRKLPFEAGASTPLLSKETIEFHHGRHHATYVKNLNALLEGHSLAGKSLFEIIQKSDGGLFNNAAQVFNHDFYWDCITSTEVSVGAETKKAIEQKFGSIEKFCEQFADSGAKQFGSGWVWLVLNKSGELEILSTSNAATPITDDKAPLLVCDVWEHAYYIDHRNDRVNYLKKFIAQINWKFVEERYLAAKTKGIQSTAEYIQTIHKG